MINTLLELIAIAAVILGTFFSLVGVLGYLRMPDDYTRLHSTGKVGVFGVVLLTVATLATTGLTFGKGLVLIMLLMLTGPVATHAIASAAYRIGIPMKDPVRDDLSQEVDIDVSYRKLK
ncbi:MAG: monovalent cation/H(+) antiporter subunit G [Chloroflexi bacterium]|nr:monovalent cation/H(+) antiporter subunit G [Chloroflexota bacterium]